MQSPRLGLVLLLALATLALLVPRPAHAQEVSLTVGRFLGDDLLRPAQPELPKISLADANIFGARFNYGVALIELEATVLTGKSAVFKNTPREIGARVWYVEGGALLKLLPGPVAPYLAAGLGWHQLSFDTSTASDSTIGYMVGAGLKVGLGPLGVRADVRDHITPLKLDGLDPGVAQVLGLDADLTLHNFELSAGLVVHF